MGSEVLYILITLLSVAVTGLIVYIAVFKNFGKEKVSDTYLKTIVQDNKDKSEEIRALQERVFKEIALRQDIENKYLLLTSSEDSKPFPFWIKDTSLKMIVLNQSYEDIFLRAMGKTRHDYLQKTDLEMWPEPVAKAYQKNDMEILSGKEDIYIGVEPIWVGDDDISTSFIIVKHPLKVGKIIAGVVGFAIPIKDKGIFEVSGSMFISHMIESGNLSPALDRLYHIVEDESKKRISILKNRLSTLESEEGSGTIRNEDAFIERNKITLAMLNILANK